MNWIRHAANVTAKGKTALKAQSLGELHARREITQGQFFTAPWIAKRMWQLLAPFIQNVRDSNNRFSVLDNSVGNGRLLADAPLDCAALYGNDIDEQCINHLARDAESANIDYSFITAGVETVFARHFDVALINPAFSITLASPLMQALPCTHYGEFGPNTHALSHEYALEHALNASRRVIALLPLSMEVTCRKQSRLLNIIRLPNDTFIEEGANVKTAVFVFGKNININPVTVNQVTDTSPWPVIESVEFHRANKTEPSPTFRAQTTDPTDLVIRTPVTHDNRVSLHHHNRQIVFKFHCGLTEAKVRNGLLKAPIDHKKSKRRPKGIRCLGDGKRFIDAYLIQPSPHGAFQSLLNEIRALGGAPTVSPTLKNYFAKAVKRLSRASTPYKHVVKRTQDATITLTAKRPMLLDPHNTSSPAIRKGAILPATPLGGEFLIDYDNYKAVLSRDEINERFSIEKDDRANTDWVTVYPGLLEQFPEITQHYRHQLKQKNINWLWPFAEESLMELLARPHGGIAAWRQGTGKARLGLALSILSSGHSLLVLETGLIDEMVNEIKKINLPENSYQILKGPTSKADLKTINIISYHTLKKTLGGHNRVAKSFRRFFTSVIVDEGGVLSNEQSQQTQAVAMLAAKRLYILDGTPIGSYSREMFQLANACVKSGTPWQPFKNRAGFYLDENFLHNAASAERGIDKFRDKHVVYDWATHEFTDTLKEGAKREIPRINELDAFRQWLAPLVQRRTRHEPDCAPYTLCPDPIYKTITVKWDKAHLVHYLDESLHYAEFFKREYEKKHKNGKKMNLIAILAQINAVMKAASSPHVLTASSREVYTPLTSKQREAIKLIKLHHQKNEKIMLFASSPDVVERLHNELAKEGISSVQFHGKRNITKRYQEFYHDFRHGDTHVALCSWVMQRGINAPEVAAVIMYDRDWTADTEDQSIARTQRPEQLRNVIVYYLHLTGSIDEYKAQMVDWKQSAADAALDYGDGATESDVFLHRDHILEQFCFDTLAMTAKDAFDHLL